jgi:hypothetical protein
MAKFEPPESEEERRAWIKRQKAKGVRAFKGRYGWATSAAPLPKNPQTAHQQDHRRNVPAVTRRWSTLTLNQCAAWRSLPKADQAVWIRVFQHTDGWIDVPQVLRARVLPPPA